MATFKEIYEERLKASVPPSEKFVKEVMAVTHRSRIAVYRWLNGSVTPDALVQEVLAKHFKTTPQELFPRQN